LKYIFLLITSTFTIKLKQVLKNNFDSSLIRHGGKYFKLKFIFFCFSFVPYFAQFHRAMLWWPSFQRITKQWEKNYTWEEDAYLISSSLSLTHSFSHTHAHTHTHTLSLSHTYTLFRTHSLSYRRLISRHPRDSFKTLHREEECVCVCVRESVPISIGAEFISHVLSMLLLLVHSIILS